MVIKNKKMEKKEIYEAQASQMKIINTFGRRHVIRPLTRESSAYPEPNYKGTGKAFVGILRGDQSLDDFKKEWVEKKLKINDKFYWSKVN